jgi:hypothetical protein
MRSVLIFAIIIAGMCPYTVLAGQTAMIIFKDGSYQGWQNIRFPGIGAASGEGYEIKYQRLDGTEGTMFMSSVERVVVLEVKGSKTLVKFIQEIDRHGKYLAKPEIITGYLMGTTVEVSTGTGETPRVSEKISFKKIRLIRLLFFPED